MAKLIKDLKEGLMTDPNYAVQFLIENNSPAIIERLQSMGFTVSTPDDVYEALNAMLEQGQRDRFLDALNVPLQTDTLDDAAATVALNAASGFLRGTPGAKKASGGEGIGWDDVGVGLATGVLAMLGAGGNNRLAQPDAAQQEAMRRAMDEAAAKQRAQTTMIVVVLIVVVVLVIGIAVFMNRKKG